MIELYLLFVREVRSVLYGVTAESLEEARQRFVAHPHDYGGGTVLQREITHAEPIDLEQANNEARGEKIR